LSEAHTEDRELCTHAQESGPTAADVVTVLTLEQRQHELHLEENSYEELVGGYQSRTSQVRPHVYE